MLSSSTNQREDPRVTICRSGPTQHIIRDLPALDAVSEVIFDKDLPDRRRTISSWNSTLLRKDCLQWGSATKSGISSDRPTPDTTMAKHNRGGVVFATGEGVYGDTRSDNESTPPTQALDKSSFRMGSPSCSEHTRKCNSTCSHFHILISLLFPTGTLHRVRVVVPRSHSSTHFRPDLSFHRFRRRDVLGSIGTAMCSWMHSWICMLQFTSTIRSSVTFNTCTWVRVWKTFAILLSICLMRTVVVNCTTYLCIRLQNDFQISQPLLRWSVIPDNFHVSHPRSRLMYLRDFRPDLCHEG